MIDLTPLDVRNKKGDFGKALRGYEPEEVDTFMDLVAERLEELVRENITLRERSERLLEQVSSQEGREKAVQEALVTAQELREEVRAQAKREADLIRREAEAEAHRIVVDAEREVKERRQALDELERKRLRFLKSFRSLLERELDVVEVEEGRAPLDDLEVELDLGGGRAGPHPDEVARADDVEGAEEEGDAAGSGDAMPPLDAPVHELAEAAAAGGAAPAGERKRPAAPAPDPGGAAAEAEGDEAAVHGTETGPEDGGQAAPAAGGPASPRSGSKAAGEEDLWLSSILQDESDEGDPRG